MPSPARMLSRIVLLVVLLLSFAILDGPGIPSWLAAVGQIGLWFGAALGVYWFVRELLLPALRRPRGP